MARITDVETGHRARANRVPAGILARLSPAELRLRCEHSAELGRQAGQIADSEISGALSARADRVLKAPPAAEYLETLRKRRAAAARMSGDARHDAHAGIAEYAAEHCYPPGWLGALDKRLLGQPAADQAMSDAADQAIAHAKRAG